jgi:hypothetical protein
MTLFYPGQLALPLTLLLAGILVVMNQFGLVHPAHVWSLWPIGLIAAGLEELYLWSVAPGEDR